MPEFHIRTSHRPWPMPPGRWVMTQRWNDLLFAHWPVASAVLTAVLPEDLEPDTFFGSGYLGVVPFWMDRVRLQGLPAIPGARSFPELNLRTYVRDRRTGTPGVYFFSLDAANPLAVLVARVWYHLPYHWAQMRIEKHGEREFSFQSRRRLTVRPVVFQARYRGLGPTRKLAESRRGSIEHFLTERYCLYAHDGAGRLTRAHIHHTPWPLEEAEAEIERNDLAGAVGLKLPNTPPILHYSRRLAVYVWQAELVRPRVLAAPVAATRPV